MKIAMIMILMMFFLFLSACSLTLFSEDFFSGDAKKENVFEPILEIPKL